jgi:hypothetical protein
MIASIEEIQNAMRQKMDAIRSVNQQKKEILEEMKKLENLIRECGKKKKITTPEKLENVEATEEDPVDGFTYKKKDLEVRLKNLEHDLEQLNSSSQLALIDFNRMLNQYQQAVQLVSNVEYREHQSVMQVINNLK